MNASKRKFNSLLSNFGNKSTSSLSSSATVNNDSNTYVSEGESKKRRVGRPNSAIDHPASTLRPALNPKAKANAMVHNKSMSLASAGLALQDGPRYAPWDRDAFLKRLESFKSVVSWMPKPAKVNEVEWAKRGWICRGSERVRCEVCNVEVLVKLNVKEVDGEEKKVLNASEIESGLVDKYAELIVTSHSETCLWRQRGCDDTIFKLPLNHAPTTLQALRERYTALCGINDRLPYLHNMRPPEDFDLDLIISYLPPNFFVRDTLGHETATTEAGHEINSVAIMMALFGWTARPETKIRDGAAVCEACFRTLGLWLFKTKEVNEAGDVVQQATMSFLDPLEQHREYCPWKNAKSQNGFSTTSKAAQGPQLAAWQIIIRVLKNDHHLREGSGEREKDKIQASLAESQSRPGTAFTADSSEGDAESVREEKDKERWARLRRVKSLFEIRPSKKVQRNSAVSEKKATAPS